MGPEHFSVAHLGPVGTGSVSPGGLPCEGRAGWLLDLSYPVGSTLNPGGKKSRDYNPHLTDEQTEALKSHATCPRF